MSASYECVNLIAFRCLHLFVHICMQFIENILERFDIIIFFFRTDSLIDPMNDPMILKITKN